MKNLFFAALFLAFGTLSCSKADDPAVDPTVNPIEVKYTAVGPQSISSTIVRDGSGNNLYKIFYPSQLTGTYPVITWGNGSGLAPNDYTASFEHLASWGYIVIDNYDGSTGAGTSVLASAQYMVAQNSVATSVFYGKVDVNHVGAVGHSQGGVGVVSAYTRAGGSNLIKTIVPISMAPNFAGGNLAYNTADVRVPIFYIGGTEDKILSPVAVSQASYDNTYSGVPALLGMRVSADHGAINNTDQDWGYLTAWLQFQLKGDQDAAKAFVGSSAEILSNPKWANVAHKNL